MSRELGDLDPKIGQGREIGDLDRNADQDYALQLPASLFPHRALIRRWIDRAMRDSAAPMEWIVGSCNLWFIRASAKVPVGLIATQIDKGTCTALIAGDAPVDDYRKRLAVIAEEAGKDGCLRFELLDGKMAADLVSDVWHLAGRA